jgi:hypothetical protein
VGSEDGFRDEGHWASEDLRRERQLEGIADAKARGVYQGRRASIDPAKVKELRAQGMGPSAIAKRRKLQKHPERATDQAADRKAAVAFEKEQKRRERERAKEEAAQRKERERRQKAFDTAQSALDAARRKHEKIASDIQAQLEALEARSQAEGARWEKEKARLEVALRRARG